MTLPDMDAIVAIMRDVVDSEIRPRFRRLANDEIRRKEKGGLVTTADMASERRLAADLTALLPGSVALGEEAAEGDLRAYDCLSGDAPVWIIDPLDGTSNYAAGNPDYVVIVALATGGLVRAGAILAPETDVLIIAEEGSGAWSAGRKLTAPPAADRPPADMEGSLGRRLRQREEVQGIFASTGTAGSCGLEYMRIALGELDFSHYRGLKPWDHAAGDLIVREAGGKVGFLDEDGYRPGNAHRHGLLSARSAAVWKTVAGIIAPALERLPPPPSS